MLRTKEAIPISALYIVLSCLLGAVCIALVVCVLMQKERAKGLGTALTGGGSANATFLDKNKGRTREGQLERYSKILAAAFFILVIILGFI